MIKKINLILLALLCSSGLYAGTISQSINSIFEEHPSQTQLKTLVVTQDAIPSDVLKNTEFYLKGGELDLRTLINYENCHDYLKAAKFFEFKSDSLKKSTYDLRVACLLKSKGEIKTLEAFTTEPNSEFFQEVDKKGNYLPAKKLELYHAGQFELDFLPESQNIQRQIADFAFSKMLSLSDRLNFKEPTLILFVGTYGAGKSYQAKKLCLSNNNSDESESGILSTDRLKRFYMQLLPGVTNSQVHHESVALRKQIMETYLHIFPTKTLVMETALNSSAEVESLLNSVPSGMKIKIIDLDVDLETSILRILCRDPAKGDPIPNFKSIVSAQKLIRETRKLLIERVQNNPNITSYELHYFENGTSHLVAKKENGIFKILSSQEPRFQKCFKGEEDQEQIAKRIVTDETCKQYPELNKVAKMTYEEALNFLNKDIK